MNRGLLLTKRRDPWEDDRVVGAWRLGRGRTRQGKGRAQCSGGADPRAGKGPSPGLELKTRGRESQHFRDRGSVLQTGSHSCCLVYTVATVLPLPGASLRYHTGFTGVLGCSPRAMELCEARGASAGPPVGRALWSQRRCSRLPFLSPVLPRHLTSYLRQSSGLGVPGAFPRPLR